MTRKSTPRLWLVSAVDNEDARLVVRATTAHRAKLVARRYWELDREPYRLEADDFAAVEMPEGVVDGR